MATKTTKSAPPSRSRRSKVEVQQEFDTIRRETEAARESANPKSVEAEQRHVCVRKRIRRKSGKLWRRSPSIRWRNRSPP
jgi:hypothetical protein